MTDPLDEAQLFEVGTIWGLVERRAALTPEAPMLRDPAGPTLTFDAYRRRAERMAAGLHGLGIGEGTPVTWQLPSSIDTIVLTAALARLGTMQNPVLHIYREREIGVVLRGARPRLYVHPGTWRGTDYAALATAALASAALDDPPALLALAEVPVGDPATLPPAPGTGADPV